MCARPRKSVSSEPASLLEQDFDAFDTQLYRSRDHKRNFLECVRSRKDPICPAEVGHRSATVCHLGNIAMRLGKTVKWDPKKETFGKDADANALIARPVRAPLEVGLTRSRKEDDMRVLAIILTCCLMTAAVCADEAEDWRPLFDGKTLDGWTIRGGKAKYRVEDDAIVGTTIPGRTVGDKQVSGTPNTFLCTDKDYGDFILELEFKVDPGMNSGVQIRSNSYREYNNGRVHGYQVEIDPSDRAWTGGIYDEGRRGWLFNLDGKEDARKAFKQNEWNHFRVEARGDNIKTWVNGIPAADLTDSMTQRGFIALQVHGSKAEKTHGSALAQDSHSGPRPSQCRTRPLR